MILTNDELFQLRETIESKTNMDDELLRRCANLLHLGAYDEAVRSAFVLLEERLRDMLGQESMYTIIQLLQNGSVTSRLSISG